MASECVLCVKLCTIFLLFTVINTTSLYESDKDLNRNDRYLYLDDSATSDRFDIHYVQKRDVSTPQPFNTNRSDQILSNNNTNISIKSENKSPNVTSNKTTVDLSNVHNNATIMNTSTTGSTTSVNTNTTKSKTTPGVKTISTITTDPTIAKNNQTIGENDEFSISNFAEEESNLNKTLKEHNITKNETDNRLYYNSSFTIDPVAAQHYWVNMTNRTDVKVNELLSQSHRRAATVKLSFDFPFYGHLIRNVTIATGGFLYTGEYVHSWLAATQYIAPLMANFDTSLSNESFVKYVDNGTAFTVQWENVALQDKPKDGNFTFQATLHRNGDIVFVYKNVPVVITEIQDDHHPVKVGLSDAYIIDRVIVFVRRKTIYEYHRVDFSREQIKNWTVIYLKASPTCLGLKDCESCLSEKTAFECTWCKTTNRCSNGMDRYRQEWLVKRCEQNQITNTSECKAPTHNDDLINHRTSTNSSANYPGNHGDIMDAKASRIAHENSLQDQAHASHVGVSGAVAVLFFVGLIAAIGAWVLYAYRNPHTTSGQLLIRYRPTKWSWRRGEARYTAATIHM